MSRTVFILGAGASKAAGAPLMLEFLDVAESLLRGREKPQCVDSFKAVFKARAALQAVHSKSTLDIDNIESVFAAFEMADLFNLALGELSADQVKGLSAAIRDVIVETLEASIAFPFRDKRIHPPVPYAEFLDLIHDFLENDPNSVTVVTFNYDLSLDYAFHFSQLFANYCLAPETKGTPLLKLHGSLNFTICSKETCQQITPWQLGEFFQIANWETYRMGSNQPARLTLNRHIAKSLNHCEQQRAKHPMIVPPTWNKTQHHKLIEPVWQKAALELSDAENIFVIGYSLPPTDLFFRYLFALGTMGDSLLKRFWVFDPDLQIQQRYQDMLAPNALKRFKFTQTNFESAIRLIRDQVIPSSRN